MQKNKFTSYTCTSAISDATYNAVRGVCSAGFITTTFPVARAGPSFHACINNGKFQGIT